MRRLSLTIVIFIFSSILVAGKKRTLTITSEPSGATVELNGSFVGYTPVVREFEDAFFKAPIWVWSKYLGESVTLRMWKEGYYPKELTLTSGPFIRENPTYHTRTIYYVIRSTEFHVILEPEQTLPPASASSRQLDAEDDTSRPAAIGGSGFLISEQGLAVTNYHVVQDYPLIEVKFPQQNIQYEARVEIKDAINDLAILRLKNFNYSKISSQVPPITFNESNPVRLGEDVYTLGFPLGQLMGSSARMSAGLINSLYGLMDDPRVLQISNPIQPGNSGGPLFNRNGELIGVVVAALNASFIYANYGAIPQNVNFAIKSSYLKNLLDMVPDGAGIFKRANPLKDKSRQDQIEHVLPYIVQIIARERSTATMAQDDNPLAPPEQSEPMEGSVTSTPTDIEQPPNVTRTASKLPAGVNFEILSNPSRASVFVNEKYSGSTPIRLHLTDGTYSIRLFLYGYKEHKQNVTINESFPETLSVELTR